MSSAVVGNSLLVHTRVASLTAELLFKFLVFRWLHGSAHLRTIWHYTNVFYDDDDDDDDDDYTASPARSARMRPITTDVARGVVCVSVCWTQS